MRREVPPSPQPPVITARPGDVLEVVLGDVSGDSTFFVFGSSQTQGSDPRVAGWELGLLGMAPGEVRSITRGRVTRRVKLVSINGTG